MGRRKKGAPWEFTSNRPIIGIDEVGVGPIAGPMVACAVARRPGVTAKDLEGVDDSKAMTYSSRERMSKIIAQYCTWSTSWSFPDDIEKHGHNNAHQMAMAKAGLRTLELLDKWPEWKKGKVLFVVDGNRVVEKILARGYDMITLTKGDKRCVEVAAASVVAKILRDKHMLTLHHMYPGYDLADNKGYATKAHLKALVELGPTPRHRKKATATAMGNWKEKMRAE